MNFAINIYFNRMRLTQYPLAREFILKYFIIILIKQIKNQPYKHLKFFYHALAFFHKKKLSFHLKM